MVLNNKVFLTWTGAVSQSPLLIRTGMQPLRPIRLNQTLTEKSKKPLFLKKGISIFEGLLKTPHKPQFLRISTPKFFVQTPLDAMKSHFQSSNGSSNVMHANGLHPIIGGGLGTTGRGGWGGCGGGPGTTGRGGWGGCGGGPGLT